MLRGTPFLISVFSALGILEINNLFVLYCNTVFVLDISASLLIGVPYITAAKAFANIKNLTFSVLLNPLLFMDNLFLERIWQIFLKIFIQIDESKGDKQKPFTFNVVFEPEASQVSILTTLFDQLFFVKTCFA